MKTGSDRTMTEQDDRLQYQIHRIRDKLFSLRYELELLRESCGVDAECRGAFLDVERDLQQLVRTIETLIRRHVPS